MRRAAGQAGVRVELVDDAIEDLERYRTSGNIRLFLSKLLYIEEHGARAGEPLGRGLTGWRKVVVGDRNWRIVFEVPPDRNVATVWVVGDRDDSACYEEATRRIENDPRPEVQSLAATMFRLSESRADKKRRKKG